MTILYTRHSPFLHLVTYIEVIKVYVKMLESSFYKNASKNNPLPQSLTLHRTYYKVDSIISS